MLKWYKKENMLSRQKNNAYAKFQSNIILFLIAKKQEKCDITFLTVALAGRGVMQPPMLLFWNGFLPARRIALEFCMAYGASFAHHLATKIDRVRFGHGAITS